MIDRISGTASDSPSGFIIESADGHITFHARSCVLFMLAREGDGTFVVPVSRQEREHHGCDLLWILPVDIESTERALLVRVANAAIHVTRRPGGYAVSLDARASEVVYFENRPACDFFGNPIYLGIPNGELLTKTLAAFYWDSMLPMVVERTLAKDYPFSPGYVLSTLQKGAYPGTYPDVDHEFQVKGRIAMADRLDLDVVKRMIELQLRVMRLDPDGKWRNPCSIQPDGLREYHVTRGCKRGDERAIMFLLTGNIEIIESVWLYVARTRDISWLEGIIRDLESVVGLVEDYMDEQGLLWSDVYFEDQVIKDGRVSIAQAFAANSFSLLAELEVRIGRNAEGDRYRSISRRLAAALVAPMPNGYWDRDNERFIDWVDRSGNVHDHIHLLANTLPLTFGYVAGPQAAATRRLLAEYDGDFQRFPSFVAARIEDYTLEEIGTGGPYDLCAAGRYWCWDAEYRYRTGDGKTLKQQLTQVAIQAGEDRYVMGERYDMNHVYYQSDRKWHGTGHYYEYPNVFAWVLIALYLGFRPSLEHGLLVSPRLTGHGEVRYAGIGYSYQPDTFSVTNHTEKTLSVALDLAALYGHDTALTLAGGDADFRNGDLVTIAPGETVAVRVLG